MKLSRIAVLGCIPFLFSSFYGIATQNELMVQASYFVVFLILMAAFFRKLDFSNWNIKGFLGISLLLLVLEPLEGIFPTNFLSLGFSLVSFIFLMREALRYTQRESANRYMLVFFFLIVALNCYFLYQHLQDMELFVLGMLQFGFYSLYYLNLLALAIIALMYYLNSYSRKSVFFISLVMAIIISDVLRDMAVFYLSDTSVLFVENFLRFWSIILAFKFFSVKEKKLRLINLV